MHKTVSSLQTLYALRIYAHTFGDAPSVLLEEWRCIGGRAVLTYCKNKKPLYPYVLNGAWDRNDPHSPDVYSPKDGMVFLRAMQSRFRSSTFCGDEGVERRTRETYAELLRKGILGAGTFKVREETDERIIYEFENETLFIMYRYGYEVIMRNGMMWLWHRDIFG